jgi:hypothetical protein
LSSAQYSITWSSACPPPVRQHRDALEIILAAAEQLFGERLVHAVAAEEQPLGFAPLLGAAVLVVDRLQIFDLRHHQRAVEPLDDPAREADVIGVRMRDDQARDVDALQRPLEQSGPGLDRFLVAEAGIEHGIAVAVGEQVDVHVVEAERQFQPRPQHAGTHLDDLFGAGMLFPGIAQGLGRGLHGVGFRVHATGLNPPGAGRQPKKAGPWSPHGGHTCSFP